MTTHGAADGAATAAALSSATAVEAPYGVVFRTATAADLDRVYALEVECFPPEEAATPEKLAYRLKHANDFFRLAIHNGQLIGFVNGTCSLSETLEHETMSHHEPEGSTLCVHSVSVPTSLRRRGLGSWLLRTYIRQVTECCPQVKRIVLIAHEHMIPLYVKSGFRLIGRSEVEHGHEEWFELRHDIDERLRTKIPFWQLDSFTTEAFRGNPAGVTVLTSVPRAGVVRTADHSTYLEKWMLAVGAERNVAETAFLQPLTNGRFSLRWMSPATEIGLCGHATLAAAKALFDNLYVPPMQDTIEFEYGSGVLSVSRTSSPKLVMTFPALPAGEAVTDAESLHWLKDGLWGADEDVQYVHLSRSTYDYLVVVERALFDALKPTFWKLCKLTDRRSVLVTARANADEGADFVSRLFAPLVGIDEDPVTGSAHCVLTPYWSGVLGKTRMTAIQKSARRGDLEVELVGDSVKLIGDVVLLMTATVTKPTSL